MDMVIHRRIESDIERRILSGEWRPGHRLPTESELMAEYGCARMTASKAMSGLAARGLVTRRRRAGTIVAHPPVHSAALAIPDIQSEVEGRGLAYAHRLLTRRIRDAEAEEAWLGVQLIQLETVHLADGAPFAHERRLISLAAAPEAESADFAAKPAGSWLLAHTPWTEAEHRISAVGADTVMARHLLLPPGSACLRLERRTWRDGQGVTWAFQTFPGDAYDLVARFQPTKA
ncbi:UTRA domain-containing protein [Brevundimonas sp. Root1279]|uniref:UTRA domain-containing protein n=1 Tax=Brevundimonas sp. Root1279 TaxID=1736443 RepID=UPI0006F7C75C|nr:UTRA domain-containing protein [Brevundimonas sp. Root1279]KQW83929.1 histidine utilization repressor [Brevundimonas sp. Root1279]